VQCEPRACSHRPLRENGAQFERAHVWNLDKCLRAIVLDRREDEAAAVGREDRAAAVGSARARR
jgi:hypothetical protein